MILPLTTDQIDVGGRVGAGGTDGESSNLEAPNSHATSVRVHRGGRGGGHTGVDCGEPVEEERPAEGGGLDGEGVVGDALGEDHDCVADRDCVKLRGKAGIRYLRPSQ